MSWFRSSKRPQDRPLDPVPVRHPERDGASIRKDDRMRKDASLLSLQRTSGNQAVQKFLEHTRGDGIAEGERKELEVGFGEDLREVRIHRDEAAGRLAAGAEASAFTTGRDIYFAPGAYTTATLAHEVNHVIQQSHAASFVPSEDASLEHQANVASSNVISGRVAEIPAVASAPALQRQAAPGAAPLSLKLLPADWLTLDSFEIDKADLSDRQRKKLDDFAQRWMSSHATVSDTTITIVGYADAPGSEPHNTTLGRDRAGAVRDYLVAKGIPKSQLKTGSRGEASPIVKSTGYEAKNRRVEIEVCEGRLTLPAAPPVPAPKPIDLTIHPERHTPTPDEDFQERLRQADKAVREAWEEEHAKKGVSAADATGRILRRAAQKLGLPKWVQDRAQSVGESLPSMGARAAVNQFSSEANSGSNARNALGALVDALMRLKAH